MDSRDESSVYPSELSSVLDPPACSTIIDAIDSDSIVLNDQVSHPLKVYVRVRPFSKAELASNEAQDCVTIEDVEVVSLRAPKDSSTMKNSERGIGQAVHKFTFTRIFGPETSQAEFFEGTMKEVVNSFTDGQNGLVFTYGVTNAGKTFTIQGTPKDGGILPRSLDVIFSHIKGRQYHKMNLKPYLGSDVMKLEAAQVKQEESMKASLLSSVKEDGMRSVSSSSNLKQSPSTSCESISYDGSVCGSLGSEDGDAAQFSAWVAFFEIYNEYVYDLLDQFPSSKTQKRPVLKICDDQSGTSYVKDLKWINIASTDEACKILQFGNKNRSLASTRMNQQSSRSHSIFTVRLLKLTTDEDPRVLSVSEMSLCDLAGSERCNKTQTVGDRLKEAGNINNSLLILGKCIGALKQSQNPKKASYVPFRESKLTRLFQPFFCGKGKACMIVNINQCASTYDETLHVMKFSAVAKQVVQSIQPRNFEFMGPRIVGKDGKVITEIDPNISVEELLSDYEDEEMDITMNPEDLLRKIEELREKLLGERQSKLVVELQIRKEMGEAMYQQMVDLDETWSKRFEDLKETHEEQLESRLEMYKKAIKNHAYRQAIEDLEDNYVPLEEFQAEQEKVEEKEQRIQELEIALGLRNQSGEEEASQVYYKLYPILQNQWLQQNNPPNRIPVYLFKSGSMIFVPAAGVENIKGAVEALTKRCQDKEKIIVTLKTQVQGIKDEAALTAIKLNEENQLLKQHLKIKEQEVKGLQSLAERAIQLEASVSELQAELDQSRKHLPSVEVCEPKPKKGLFSNIRNTMAGTPKRTTSKSQEKPEEVSATSRKRPLLSRK